MQALVNTAGQTGEVATMYVKGAPEALVRRVRATAAERGETMREFVLRAIRAELERLGVEVPEDDA